MCHCLPRAVSARLCTNCNIILDWNVPAAANGRVNIALWLCALMYFMCGPCARPPTHLFREFIEGRYFPGPCQVEQEMVASKTKWLMRKVTMSLIGWHWVFRKQHTENKRHLSGFICLIRLEKGHIYQVTFQENSPRVLRMSRRTVSFIFSEIKQPFVHV